MIGLAFVRLSVIVSVFYDLALFVAYDSLAGFSRPVLAGAARRKAQGPPAPALRFTVTPTRPSILLSRFQPFMGKLDFR